MKTARKFRADRSGQLLIVAALAIAILIASTSIYVYELTMEQQTVESGSAVELALAVKTGLRNAIISALANITNGGQRTVLAENLGMLACTYMQLHPQQLCQIHYTLLNNNGYEDGVKLSWNNNGLGVSSAYTSFTLKILGLTSNITINEAVNVTTFLTVEGYYTANGNESIKTVRLTCNIFNENKPAKAKKIAVYWEQAPELWVPVENPDIADLGNGTYTITFAVTTASESVNVSVQIVDARNIFVMANATCNQAG
ncbi:MAG: hypothetical protein QXZ68_07370 [Candidatus Bathyarchaeia archaeon]